MGSLCTRVSSPTAPHKRRPRKKSEHHECHEGSPSSATCAGQRARNGATIASRRHKLYALAFVVGSCLLFVMR